VLGLGLCHVREKRYAEATELLTPLARSRDRQVANDAAIWTARAWMALGVADSAQVYLSAAIVSDAQWELAQAYLASRRFVPAESLLVIRAAAGDFRPELLAGISALWGAGLEPGVRRVVEAADRSRMRQNERARLHLHVGDLYLAAGNDTAALPHFVYTQRALRDSMPGREAAARQTVISLRELATLEEVDSTIARGRAAGANTGLQRRLENNLVFLKVLRDRADYTGSSLFLAGEVARDSLRSRALAHTLFKQVLTTRPGAPVAPKALLAAASVMPDSAESYHARLREEYPTSPYTMQLDRPNSPLIGQVLAAEQLLQQAWRQSASAYAESLAVRRKAEEAQAAVAQTGSAARRPPPRTTPAASPPPPPPPPPPALEAPPR
jgi:hypothetical protein